MNRVILWDALERIQFLEGWDIDSPQCSQSVGNWMLVKGKFRCFFNLDVINVSILMMLTFVLTTCEVYWSCGS